MALEAVVEHADLFSEWFLARYREWFTTLKWYVESVKLKTEGKAVAFKAFEKFITHCAQQLGERKNQSSPNGAAIQV